MNLVVGATGMVGTEICRLLRASGKPVMALVRRNSDPSKLRRLEELGASVVRGDLREPRSLELACEGVDAVIGTVSAMPFAYDPNDNTPRTTDQDGYLNLVAAASKAAVQRLVYVSFPPMTPDFPLQQAKRAVEDRQATGRSSWAMVAGVFLAFIAIVVGGIVGTVFLVRWAWNAAG